MEEKKTAKLRWVNPVLENLSKTKMTRGADCGLGSSPGGGIDNCKPGSLANGCEAGTDAASCNNGTGPFF